MNSPNLLQKISQTVETISSDTRDLRQDVKALSKKISYIETKVDGIETRMSNVEERVTILETEFKGLRKEMHTGFEFYGTHLAGHDKRFEQLEAKIDKNSEGIEYLMHSIDSIIDLLNKEVVFKSHLKVFSAYNKLDYVISP